MDFEKFEEIPELILSPEEENELLENAPEVAKTKGLSSVEDGKVKYFRGSVVYKDELQDIYDSAIEKQDVSVALRAIEADEKRDNKPKRRRPEDYRPSQDDLEKLAPLTNTTLEPDSGFVFDVRAMDQMPDRQFDIVQRQALIDAAKLSPDKPILLDHNRSAESVRGKIFDADVRSKALMQKIFIDGAFESLSRGIILGINNKVSVSFATSPKHVVCSSCKNKSIFSMECPHMPGRKDENGDTVFALIKRIEDFFETSFVAVPAQPRAGVRRSPVDESTMPELAMKSEDGENMTDKTPNSAEMRFNLETKIPEYFDGESWKSLETTKELTQKDIYLTNEILEEEEYTTSSEKNSDVDRIINEKLDEEGENSVSDKETTVDKAETPEVTPEDVQVPSVEEEKSEEAPEATTEDIAVTEEKSEETEEASDDEAINKLAEIVDKFTETVNKFAEAESNRNAVLSKLVESINAQSELIQKAMTLEADNPTVESVDETAKSISMHEPGGLQYALNQVFGNEGNEEK